MKQLLRQSPIACMKITINYCLEQVIQSFMLTNSRNIYESHLSDDKRQIKNRKLTQ